MKPVRGFLAVALALTLILASAPASLAQESLSDDEFEQLLADLQQRSRQAVGDYEAGDTEAALEQARHVRDAFSFEHGEASALERKIKEVSAVAIGEQVKAQASRLVGAIEAGESLERVRSLQEDLEPQLNRIVLVAQGEHAPASQRELRTDEAIQQAVDEVRELVGQAVASYEDGETQAAQRAAEDAFFVFESNGVGPDVTVVDETLENAVENDIKNFQGDEADPGLADLIADEAPLEQVHSQAEVVHDGLDQVEELLKATKPPTDLGDVDHDGQVSIVDALLTAQASLGIRGEDAAMDANQDGAVTIVDALVIAQAALGIRSL